VDNPYAPPPDSGRRPPGGGQRPAPPSSSRGRLDEEQRDRGHQPGPDAGRPRPAPPRPRPSPEQVRAAGRRTLAATSATLATLVVTSLPLPWPALGVPLSIGAVVLGIRALLAARAAGLQRSVMPLLAVGLVLSLLYVVYSLSILATWSIHQDRHDCLARAVTVSARDACDAEFQEEVRYLVTGATGADPGQRA
jgi:hypothetical protein